MISEDEYADALYRALSVGDGEACGAVSARGGPALVGGPPRLPFPDRRGRRDRRPAGSDPGRQLVTLSGIGWLRPGTGPASAEFEVQNGPSALPLEPGRHVLLAFAKSPEVEPTAELFAQRDDVLEALPRSEDPAPESGGHSPADPCVRRTRTL